MIAHKYGAVSWRHLLECRDLLQEHAVKTLELSPYDLGIRDGGRTLSEQRHYVQIGASRTERSRHRFAWPLKAPINGAGDLERLPAGVPVSHAYDYVILINGKYRTEDPLYVTVWEQAILPAAELLGLKLSGGYFWKGANGRYFDLGHVQLDWSAYPAEYATDAEVAELMSDPDGR